MTDENSGFIELTEAGHHTTDDGCRIYFETHGSGPQKIVLIQGFHTSLLTWKHQVEFFVTDTLRRYQVLILDNRGYGKSDRPAALYTTKRLAMDVHSLVKRHLNWKHYHLVGQSMGGMIAQELALLDLPSLLSLTLVVTHAGGISGFPSFETLAKAFAVVLAREISVDDHAASILKLQYPEAWLESHYEGTATSNRSYMTTILAKDLRWGCPDGRPPIFGLAGQLSAVARHYVSYERLKKMKSVLGAQGTPILIIVSSEDSLIRVHNSVLLRDILDCKIAKVDLSGHMLHYQIPAAFNNVLQTHFDAAPPEPNTSAPTSSAPVLPLAKL